MIQALRPVLAALREGAMRYHPHRMVFQRVRQGFVPDVHDPVQGVQNHLDHGATAFEQTIAGFIMCKRCGSL